MSSQLQRLKSDEAKLVAKAAGTNGQDDAFPRPFNKAGRLDFIIG
jgi:hypothetical protein